MGVTVYSKDPMVKKILQRGPTKLSKEITAKEETKPKRARIWAVDFDGTLCGNSFPKIGKPNSELIETLIFCKMRGVRLILWTNRTGAYLDEAVEWCWERGLRFDAVNENLPEIIEQYGTDPRKICADLYIDDKAFPYWGNGERGNLCRLQEKV